MEINYKLQEQINALYISKNKIEMKIKELKDSKNVYYNENKIDIIEAQINILDNLLRGD